MPRGRPPKNKGITIKSKETKIFFGLILLGVGIGLAMSNPSSGQLLLAVYNFLGDVRFILAFLLLALGLKLIGVQNHITSTKTIYGISLLFFTSTIFLGFLWHYVAKVYNPGILGHRMHLFLDLYLGPYLEIAFISPIFLLSLSLLADIKFEQLVEFLKLLVSYLLSALKYIKQIIGRVGELLVSTLVRVFRSTSTELSRNKQSLIDTQGPQILDQGVPLIPEHKTTNTQPPAQSNQQASLTLFENETTVEIKEPQTDAAAESVQPSSTEPAPAEPRTPAAKPAKPKVSLKVGTPLYPTKTTTKPTATEPESEPDPLIERFKQNYKYSTLEVPNPPITIFDPPVSKPMDATTLQQTSQKIEQALASFKIQAKVTRIVVGPTVVQYAINLATGTKISKVESLAKDLAVAIAAPKGSVRIEAIAGTNLIGIEVPRPDPRIVRIREVIASEAFKDSTDELPMAIGVNVHNQPVVLNLYDMPHLLVAGATGTGKSVTLNAIIASMLVRFSPQNLRLILVDPKMVEMEPYNDIPHLLTPVITDMNQVVGVLEWLLFEMQQRYQLFKKERVRNLKEYNTSAKVKLPYIVLIIDEMADLILTKRNEVETKIVRLAQLARATGIHLILATQRPSVNVITGLIKSNIPARIALGVTSGVDSRVILDQQGAETLIGKGDMLIKTPSGIKPIRVQGAFISTHEVQRLTNYLRNKAKELLEKSEEVPSIYVQEILEYMQNGGRPEVSLDKIATDPSQLTKLDALLPQAIDLVLKTRKPSASSLQRYLKIGFNRAARLIDYMEKLGVISPPIGNRRQVLIESIEEIG